MLTIRRDADIFDMEGGWFRARWHFSFDQYVDPDNDSFGAMRVFNDDRRISRFNRRTSMASRPGGGPARPRR